MNNLESLGGLPPAQARALAYERARLLAQSIITKVPDHPDLQRYAHDMKSCGLLILLRHYYETGQIQAKAANSCRHRGCCPLCAVRTARKNAGALAAKLQQLKPWTFQLVTITQPDVADWSLGLDLMQLTHKRFMKAWRNGRSLLTMQSFFNHYIGGLYHLELKTGKNSGLAHPHIHYLMHGKGVTTEDWLSSHSSHTKKNHPLSIELAQRNPLGGFICDVRDLRAEDEAELRKSLMEVCKYVHDFKMGSSEVWKVQQAILRRRLSGNFGSLRGLKLDSQPDDIITENDAEMFVEHVLTWENDQYSMQESCLMSFEDMLYGA